MQQRLLLALAGGILILVSSAAGANDRGTFEQQVAEAYPMRACPGWR